MLSPTTIPPFGLQAPPSPFPLVRGVLSSFVGKKASICDSYLIMSPVITKTLKMAPIRVITGLFTHVSYKNEVFLRTVVKRN